MHKEWDKNYHYENFMLELNEHPVAKYDRKKVAGHKVFLIIYGLSMAGIIKFCFKGIF